MTFFKRLRSAWWAFKRDPEAAEKRRIEQENAERYAIGTLPPRVQAIFNSCQPPFSGLADEIVGAIETRFKDEQVTLMMYLIRRDPKFVLTPAVQKWAVKNARLMASLR